MKKNNRDMQKSSPFLSSIIKLFFDMIKHFIKDFENMRKVKKIDNFAEKFSSLEHMLIRLENKIQENRKIIEDLKNRILWGNVIIVVLLLIILYDLLR